MLLAVPVAHLVQINLSAQKKMNFWGQSDPGSQIFSDDRCLFCFAGSMPAEPGTKRRVIRIRHDCRDKALGRHAGAE